MTMQHETLQAIWRVREFLNELLVTPRVPNWIRSDARRYLKHYPCHLSDLEEAIEHERQRP